MATRSIRSRLADLERGSKSHGPIVVCSRVDETSGQAIERGIAEGSLTEADRANRLIVVVRTFASGFGASDAESSVAHRASAPHISRAVIDQNNSGLIPFDKTKAYGS
jgi:hypothetical protein